MVLICGLSRRPLRFVNLSSITYWKLIPRCWRYAKSWPREVRIEGSQSQISIELDNSGIPKNRPGVVWWATACETWILLVYLIAVLSGGLSSLQNQFQNVGLINYFGIFTQTLPWRVFDLSQIHDHSHKCAESSQFIVAASEKDRVKSEQEHSSKVRFLWSRKRQQSAIKIVL